MPDAITGSFNLRHHVRRHEYRLALLLLLLKHLLKFVLQEGIEPGRRFVEDQQIGIVHEGLNEADLLFVAF